MKLSLSLRLGISTILLSLFFVLGLASLCFGSKKSSSFILNYQYYTSLFAFEFYSLIKTFFYFLFLLVFDLFYVLFSFSDFAFVLLFIAFLIVSTLAGFLPVFCIFNLLFDFSLSVFCSDIISLVVLELKLDFNYLKLILLVCAQRSLLHSLHATEDSRSCVLTFVGF